ncbi:MAG: TIGR03842 family LLM class F420-dependent oxidoreductase [Nocardiopsaceae bacterium]|jgi:probable F420-dependent oxidoreductase|nr:TIGR03842 family LLM class F420-dependent oxidoreductase [Nocardiopsaceae bacterium]
MDIGLVLQTDPPARQVIETAVRADAGGFSHVWTFDSCVLWQEPFVIYSQILARTSRVMVGPMVTNPLSREPSVTASLFATLNDMFGNRTVCGIGRGDSAMRVLGRPPASLATLSAAMRTIRDLAEGREVSYRGTAVRIPWVTGGRLEIWMAGYGPKALRLCGEEADGFILQCADPDVARWTIGTVRAAAAAAGRDPAAVTVCVAAPAYVGEDYPHMRDQTRWFGGMVGNHVADLVARYGDTGDAVPQALTDYIKARQGYDYSHHGKPGNPSTDFVPDDIVDRFCLLGPVERQRDRLAELREIGADNFSIYLMHDAPEATLAAYESAIIGNV